MIAPHIFRFLFFLSCIAFVKALVLANKEPLSVNPAQEYEFSINYRNGSTLAWKTGPANMDYRCDGDTYGKYPDLVDCRVAYETVGPSSRQTTFGQRHTGLPDTVVALPFLAFGGTRSILNEN